VTATVTDEHIDTRVWNKLHKRENGCPISFTEEEAVYILTSQTYSYPYYDSIREKLKIELTERAILGNYSE